jgi:hypothetical protein
MTSRRVTTPGRRRAALFVALCISVVALCSAATPYCDASGHRTPTHGEMTSGSGQAIAARHDNTLAMQASTWVRAHTARHNHGLTLALVLMFFVLLLLAACRSPGDGRVLLPSQVVSRTRTPRGPPRFQVA